MILPLRLEEVSFVARGRAIIERISLEVEAGHASIILALNAAAYLVKEAAQRRYG